MVEIVKILLDKGADVNALDRNDRTSLHYLGSCVCEDTKKLFEVAELLIASGAHINAVDKQSRTPIEGALEHNLPKVVEFFIGKGASVSDQTMGAEFVTCGTPLHRAAAQGCENAVEKLVRIEPQEGSYVNAVNIFGKTPLFLAIANRHNNIIKILLEHKANVNYVDENGSTALHAVFYADANDLEIELKQLEIVARLISGNLVNINAQNADTMGLNNGTPLHCVAQNASSNRNDVFDWLRH